MSFGGEVVVCFARTYLFQTRAIWQQPMHHEIKALVSFKGKRFFDAARSDLTDLANIATGVAAASTLVEPNYWKW